MARKVERAVGTGLAGARAVARTAALATGAAEVIGRRVAMGALAPATLEAGAEALRMVPEKAAALSAGAAAGAMAGGRIFVHAFGLAMAEMGHAGRAAASVAAARTPMAAAMAQAGYMMGLFGRMTDAAVALSGQALRANMAAMAPAARAVAGNARRLRRG